MIGRGLWAWLKIPDLKSLKFEILPNPCVLLMRKCRTLDAAGVYDLLLRIPEGRVTTYGDIARALGCRGGSRAVGRILNKNPSPITVPCHRVVMSDGSIGGYALGKRRKKELLAKEGLRILGDMTDDFARLRVTDLELLSASSLPSPNRAGVRAIELAHH